MTQPRTATIHGRTHRIPDIWLAGMAQQGYDVHAAVAHWDAQTLMEKQAETPDELTADERDYLAAMFAEALGVSR